MPRLYGIQTRDSDFVPTLYDTKHVRPTVLDKICFLYRTLMRAKKSETSITINLSQQFETWSCNYHHPLFLRSKIPKKALRTKGFVLLEPHQDMMRLILKNLIKINTVYKKVVMSDCLI